MVFELNSDDLEREVKRPATNEIQNSPLTQIAKYVAANSEVRVAMLETRSSKMER